MKHLKFSSVVLIGPHILFKTSDSPKCKNRLNSIQYPTFSVVLYIQQVFHIGCGFKIN